MLINCIIPLIFHIVVREVCDISQARSTVTTSPVSGASCYIIRVTLLHHTGHVVTAKNVWIVKKVSLIHVTVITLIGLYIGPLLIHRIHSVRNNVGVHSFI